jgi:hypothetical protein
LQYSTNLSNAGKAKVPLGKIKFTMNGTSVETPQNQNQCMIVGMGNEYGQLMVSGGNKISIIYVGKQKIGPVEIRKTAGMPNVGLQITDNGIQYTNMTSGGDVKLEITKMTPDGNNTYIAGTFSGTLKSLDGKKTMVVSNGAFESGYVK